MRRLRQTAVYIATLLAVAAFTMPALVTAATPAGRTIYATGDVSASDAAGSRRALTKGDFVVSGDTVVTGEGRVQLKLTDGGFIALDHNTEYAIEEYAYDEAAPSTARSFFNLLKGGVRLVSGAVARSNRKGWRMRTSVATIGIRGSGGYFRYTNPDTLRITVDEGAFTSTDPDTGLVTDLPPGEYICESPCRPFSGPDTIGDGGFNLPAQEGYEGGEDHGIGSEESHSHPEPPTPQPQQMPGY